MDNSELALDQIRTALKAYQQNKGKRLESFIELLKPGMRLKIFNPNPSCFSHRLEGILYCPWEVTHYSGAPTSIVYSLLRGSCYDFKVNGWYSPKFGGTDLEWPEYPRGVGSVKIEDSPRGWPFGESSGRGVFEKVNGLDLAIDAIGLGMHSNTMEITIMREDDHSDYEEIDFYAMKELEKYLRGRYLYGSGTKRALSHQK